MKKTLLKVVALVLMGLSSASAANTLSAEELIKAGHSKRARAIVEPRYKADPGDPELNYLLSEIQDAFRNLERARQLAQEAVALNGTDARYHLQLAIVDGKTAESASLFARAGWAKKFRIEAEKAAQLDPKSLDARFSLLEFYLQAPRLMGGGRDKAETMAAEIARIDPASGALAAARLAQSEKDAVREESGYLKAIALDPANYEALIRLGLFYTRKPNPKLDLAGKYGRQAVAADPSRVDGYSLLASALASEARWSELDSVLVEAAKNVPEDLTPCYQASRAIVEGSTQRSPDLDRAEGYLRRYLSAEPEGNAPSLAYAHRRLGLVLGKAGRRPEAVSELRLAFQLDPNLEEASRDLKRME